MRTTSWIVGFPFGRGRVLAGAAIASLFLIVMGSTADRASADDPVGAARVRRIVGAWTLVPVRGPSQSRVEAIFAFADPSALVGGNFPMVAYIRDGGGNNFSVWGWPAGTVRGDALAWLHGIYGDGFLASEEELNDELGVVAVPLAIVSGVASDDPLLAVVQEAENPGAVLAEVTSVGWEAAPLLSGLNAMATASGTVDTTVPCGEVAVLSEGLLLAVSVYQFENALMGGSTIADPDPCVMLCAGCVDTEGPWSAWTVTEAPDGDTAYSICTYTRTRSTWAQGYTIWSCARCVRDPADGVQVETRRHSPGMCGTEP